MSQIPYHVARAFLDGLPDERRHHRKAGNFHAERDTAARLARLTGHSSVDSWAAENPADLCEVIYTYDVPLAVRLPDGRVCLPAYDGRRHFDALSPVPNLLRSYSRTSDRHQKALRVEIDSRLLAGTIDLE